LNNKQDLVSAAIVDMMEIVEESGRMDFRFLALLGYLEDHVPEIAVETSAEPLDHDPEDLAEYDAGESPWDDDFLAESDGGGLFDENDPLPF
jgi:hypothetical protein